MVGTISETEDGFMGTVHDFLQMKVKIAGVDTLGNCTRCRMTLGRLESNEGMLELIGDRQRN